MELHMRRTAVRISASNTGRPVVFRLSRPSPRGSPPQSPAGCCRPPGPAPSPPVARESSISATCGVGNLRIRSRMLG
ncbi:hypothetical protein [Oryza sativa Japonica Group]|uniref:Uncharacterized protein n=1 Tax=Oryza sativa subsp. japonica TaxID=39947 RepID=Q5JNI0_ORYSJ|nr:hypothetical protein [Oryza sativa Japonica Group]